MMSMQQEQFLICFLTQVFPDERLEGVPANIYTRNTHQATLFKKDLDAVRENVRSLVHVEISRLDKDDIILKSCSQEDKPHHLAK